MKGLRFLFMILILIIIPVQAYASLDSMRISLIDGDVQIKTEDTSDWVAASINMPLREGDNIWVPEGGNFELQMKNGTSLRLGENSSLQILGVEKDSVQYYLSGGHAYVNFKGYRGDVLQIDTPLASARAYDRSSFRIDVADDGFTEISVFKGALDTEGRGGKTRVSAGKTLSIGEQDYAELSPLGPADDWERWNIERDRKLYERRESSRYLPDELESYSSDFDDNGKWVYVKEYGNVWTPTVVVSTGWAPYRTGRWTWIGGDYVWISYEPWGWAPYHYGRWSFIVSIGWCWVPPVRGAVYWGPGFVGWVHTPTYVAWVPLAPDDIYYGYGYYGPNSVNIVNINVHKTVIKKVYKNVHVHNSVTVINHETFVKGKHKEVKIAGNPFEKEKINIGRPDIKPVKDSSRPVIKDISMEKQPPKRIKEIKAKDLKAERPLVKKRDVSVMKHGQTLKPMTVKARKEPKKLVSPKIKPMPVEKQDKGIGAKERPMIHEKEKRGGKDIISPRERPMPVEKGRKEGRGVTTPKQKQAPFEREKQREEKRVAPPKERPATLGKERQKEEKVPAPQRQGGRVEKQERKMKETTAPEKQMKKAPETGQKPSMKQMKEAPVEEEKTKGNKIEQTPEQKGQAM